VTGKASSKADLGIADEEDVSDDSSVYSLTLLVEQMFIPDLDMKVLIFKILGDDLYLLLTSELAPCVCLPTEIIILLCGNYWEAFLAEKA
jgi:hypothetical protein